MTGNGQANSMVSVPTGMLAHGQVVPGFEDKLGRPIHAIAQRAVPGPRGPAPGLLLFNEDGEIVGAYQPPPP